MTEPGIPNDNGSESREFSDAPEQSRAELQEPHTQDGPEPPASWNMPQHGNTPNPQGFQSFQQQPPQQQHQQPHIAVVRGLQYPLTCEDAELFESGKKYQSAAQICALVSLFIGGMILSAASIVLAVIGFRKYAQINPQDQSSPFKAALKRSSTIAIVLCVIALVLNVVSFIAFYPMMMEIVQNGDLSSIFGFGTSTTTGSSTSTWG